MENQNQNQFSEEMQADRIKLVVETGGTGDSAHVISGFHDLRLLAEGATGIVYSAKADEDNSDVAIKIYKKELVPNTDSAKRFDHEIFALSRIAHPNIVKIISSGQTESRRSFIVMDLVDGVSIRTILETEGVFEPVRAVKVAKEICRALEALHSKEIIHRDLKPNNIILDSSNIAKIVDFGIAKVLSSTNDTITHYGSILGTPAYMSPEQCLGHKVDERSDVYSLGCTLFEMLTGTKAFEASTAMEALAKQIDGDRSFLEKPLLASGSPSDLRSIVMKCLEREPDARYQNVGQLSHDLGAFQLGAPLTFAAQKSSTKKTTTATAGGDKNLLVVQKLRANWQVIACCSALIVAAIIIRFNLDTITGSLSKSGPQQPARVAAPFVLYNQKTHEPLYSDVKALNAREALSNAIKLHVPLQYVDLSGTNFDGVNLDGVDFSHANLSNSNLINASLIGANLHGAILRGTSLQHSILNKADLSAAQLDNAMLQHAVGSSANFMGADLTNANLSMGNFNNANFRNANLTEVRLTETNLAGADLSFAECSGARFWRLRSSPGLTNFSGAKNVNLSN